MITEVSVNVTPFVVLLTLFGVLTGERLLVKGGCPLQDAGCATGFGRAYEWVSGDKGVLSSHKDDPKVAVLDPAAGNLNLHFVCG